MKKARYVGPIFLSHSSKDKPFVRDLRERLEHKDFQVWLDEKDMVPGDSLATTLSDALAICKVVIVVVSQNSVHSKWLKFELNKAITKMVEGTCRVIPVLMGDVSVPNELRGILYADFRKSQDEGLKAVFAALEVEATNALEKSRDDIHNFIEEYFDFQGAAVSEGDYTSKPYYYFKLKCLEAVSELGEPYSGGTCKRVVYEIVKDEQGLKKPLNSAWWQQYDYSPTPYQTSFFFVVTERPVKIREVSPTGIPDIWYKMNAGREMFGQVIVFADISQTSNALERRLVIANARLFYDRLCQWLKDLRKACYDYRPEENNDPE